MLANVRWLLVGFALAALPAALLVSPRPAAGQERGTPPGDEISRINTAFEQAAAKINPSVVAIFSESTITRANPRAQALRQFFGNQFYQRFFGEVPGREEQTVHALGSGVIASADGYILTNNHVVAGAQQLTVVLPNGERRPAKVIGTDPETDLALIKVDAHGLQAAHFGDSNQIKVGEWVIAVGNPFELLHTTTAGIISAMGRSSVGLSDYKDFIQTDAPINPGNSGGALASLNGEVIGINSEISSPSGGSVGLGFAIPINIARRVMEQLKAHGKVIRGYLGVLLQPLTPPLAKALGLKPQTKGVLIGDVMQGTPAYQAGFERGDVISEFAGKPVTGVVGLRFAVADMQPGTRTEAQVIRDGRTRTLHVTLGEQPQHGATAAAKPPGATSPEKVGLTVQTLTPDLAQQLGYQGDAGAVIVQVQPGSAADNAGLQQGDLIEEVDRHRITTARELASRLRGMKSGDTAALLVNRGGNTRFVPLQIP